MAAQTLTTPCTLAQLHEFINHVVDALESGEENTAAVTSTTSTIVVTG
jgi:hypothetical protein